MVSIERCRQLLGASADAMQASEIEALRASLSDLAQAVYTLYGQKLSDTKVEKGLLDSLPRDERVEIEERAAVLEFDGNMNRDHATRLAVMRHVKYRPKAS